MGTAVFNEIVTSSPGKSANHLAYTGEIVASTPIKSVSAKNPPKKIAIFAMSTPESRIAVHGPSDRPTAWLFWGGDWARYRGT